MEKKEFAVGEEFQFGSKKLKVEKDTAKTPCTWNLSRNDKGEKVMRFSDEVKKKVGQSIRLLQSVKGARCRSWERLDKTGCHFVRLLPLGDEYEQGGAMWQQYKCIEKPNTEDKRVYISDTDLDVGLIVSIRLTNPDDMESKVGEVKNENLSNTEKIGKRGIY